MKELHTSLLFSLRLAFIEELKKDALENVLKYITHATGVIIRAYDVSDIDLENDNKLIITASNKDDITTISINNTTHSLLGINQSSSSKANENSTKILFETSYIHPTTLVDIVAEHKLETDELYYNTSRGSEPQLCFGIDYLTYLFETYTQCKLFDGTISAIIEPEEKIISIGTNEISKIIGNDVSKTKIMTILTALQFKVQNSSEDKFGITVPLFRHDIHNIQDVTEEIVRILGIENIEAKPFCFKEKQRINHATVKYQAKKALRLRATAAAFDESISYAFTDKTLLEKYNFPIVSEELDIINPITTDFNTLRTTILINLLQAVQRNVNYSKKSIALFEIGTVFNKNREEKEMFSLIYSGQSETEYVTNSGKPNAINFDIFVKKISSIIGNFELRDSLENNALIHPYQSADIIINNEICGFLTKVHPSVTEAFDIGETFVAEINFNKLIPQHINANPISNFQGVYKDLSLIVDKFLPYSHLSLAIKSLKLPLLNKYYPIDVYEDETLNDQKSLTLRLFIQSLDKTLDDTDIDFTVNSVLEKLQAEYGATLR